MKLHELKKGDIIKIIYGFGQALANKIVVVERNYPEERYLLFLVPSIKQNQKESTSVLKHYDCHNFENWIYLKEDV